MTQFGQSAVFWLRNHRMRVLTALSLLVFVMVAFALTRMTQGVRHGDVVGALQSVPPADIVLAIALTGLSFLFLIRQDLNALHHIGQSLPLPQALAVSFSANAIGNSAGFGPLSSDTIRYRGYGRLGLSGDAIARAIAFLTLTSGLTALILTAIALVVFGPEIDGFVAFGPKILWLGTVALALAGLSGGMVLWRKREQLVWLEDGGRVVRLTQVRDIGWQALATAGQLIAASLVLYVLMPQNLPVGWIAFCTLYCVAFGLGKLSHVPAGLGVFEAVILAGLGHDIALAQVLAGLVLYRLIYHVLPLLGTVLALAATELLEHRETMARIWASPLSAAIIPPLLAVLTLICGAMLVFSSVLPTPAENLRWLARVVSVPLEVLEATHFVSSVLGLLLIVVARGLVYRLDGAYWSGVVIVSLAILCSLPKAFAAWEAAILGILLVGLVLNRRSFSRPASLFAEPLTPVWLGAIMMIIVAAVTILFFSYRDVHYTDALWWKFEFSAEAPRGLRAILGVALAAVFIALASLLRPARARATPPSADDIARAVEINRQHGESGGNLVRMGDKSLLFSEDGQAFVMYSVQGRSWISLFGPIGAPAAQAELIWRFVEMSRAAGGRAVFYEVGPDLLPACADVGLRALKLGEMARVDLHAMDLQTSRWGEQRRSLNKGQRDGMSVEILPPDQVPTVIGRLEEISNGWLSHHQAREKGFALGRFERTFVADQPVAVLRMNDQIVAFATVMQTDTKDEACVDLMRFAPEAPKGAMDFLFVSLFVAMKQSGFRYFNLGMAPMSGFATHASAPVWNHVGQAIFTHGERFYNFQGLRAFKAKYYPEWEPRYLVVGGQVSPITALLDVTLLIGGGIKGVVGK